MGWHVRRNFWKACHGNSQEAIAEGFSRSDWQRGSVDQIGRGVQSRRLADVPNTDRLGQTIVKGVAGINIEQWQNIVSSVDGLNHWQIWPSDGHHGSKSLQTKLFF